MLNNHTVIRISLKAVNKFDGIDFLYKILNAHTFLKNTQGNISVLRYANRLDVIIHIEQNNLLDDVLSLIWLYYQKILSELYPFVNSKYDDEDYICHLEIPIYAVKNFKFSFHEILRHKYQIRFISSYLKSETGHIVRISKSEKLDVFINNIYNISLASLQITHIHDIRRRMSAMELLNDEVEQVMDLGCGDGSFLFNLAKLSPNLQLIGIDLDQQEIQLALKKKEEFFKEATIKLINSNILHLQKEKIEAVTLIEVIEHIERKDLDLFFSSIFNNLCPELLIITTPNYDYNIYDRVNPTSFRHWDHKFELTQLEFKELVNQITRHGGYSTKILPVGFVAENKSSITQMAIIKKISEMR